MTIYILFYCRFEDFGQDFDYAGYIKAFKNLNDAITFAESIKEDKKLYLPDEEIQHDLNNFINTYYQIKLETIWENNSTYLQPLMW